MKLQTSQLLTDFFAFTQSKFDWHINGLFVGLIAVTMHLVIKAGVCLSNWYLQNKSRKSNQHSRMSINYVEVKFVWQISYPPVNGVESG